MLPQDPRAGRREQSDAVAAIGDRGQRCDNGGAPLKDDRSSSNTPASSSALRNDCYDAPTHGSGVLLRDLQVGAESSQIPSPPVMIKASGETMTRHRKEITGVHQTTPPAHLPRERPYDAPPPGGSGVLPQDLRAGSREQSDAVAATDNQGRRRDDGIAPRSDDRRLPNSHTSSSALRKTATMPPPAAGLVLPRGLRWGGREQSKAASRQTSPIDDSLMPHPDPMTDQKAAGPKEPKF